MSVGDMLKFGQSTRMYILAGPGDLMPAEGPSREERKKVAMAKARAAQAVRCYPTTPMQPNPSLLTPPCCLVNA
eukprot:5912508-Pyramimonas_sp.AAC.1